MKTCPECGKGYVSTRDYKEMDSKTKETIDVFYAFCSNVLCDWHEKEAVIYG